MKSFSDLGIKPAGKAFTGDKIKIERVLNRSITVVDHRLVDSKYAEKSAGGKCLHLQIILDGEHRVVFTGSGVLIDMISRVEQADFPFTTTIVKNGEHYEFT